MGFTARKILPLTLFLNLLLSVTFLAYSGTLRLPRFPGSVSDQHTARNPAWTVELTPKSAEPVSFAMVMYGESSAKEGLLALKTILMHISRPAEFHIVCSLDAIPIIEGKLELFSR